MSFDFSEHNECFVPVDQQLDPLGRKFITFAEQEAILENQKNKDAVKIIYADMPQVRQDSKN